MPYNIDMKQTLFLMFGLPGAGKTTAAEIIEELTGAVRLTSDEARLMIWPQPSLTEEEHQQLYEYLDDQTEHLLEAGRSVVYDANLNRFEHRLEKYALAQRFEVDTQLIWVQADRNLAKSRRVENQHPLLVPSSENPDQMFERTTSVIEEPRSEEPYIALDGTKLTATYIKQVLQL